jgi:hypothetical protein
VRIASSSTGARRTGVRFVGALGLPRSDRTVAGRPCEPKEAAWLSVEVAAGPRAQLQRSCHEGVGQAIATSESCDGGAGTPRRARRATTAVRLNERRGAIRARSLLLPRPPSPLRPMYGEAAEDEPKNRSYLGDNCRGRAGRSSGAQASARGPRVLGKNPQGNQGPGRIVSRARATSRTGTCEFDLKDGRPVASAAGRPGSTPADTDRHKGLDSSDLGS